MFYESIHYYAAILLPIIAGIIYLIAYSKLKWEFLWLGFTGACLSALAGFDFIYDIIDYENMEMIDYLVDTLWIVGWALEVICLYMILDKAREIQANRDSDNPVIR